MMDISSTLFASLIWGSIGMGFAIYGKKQRTTVPLVGGILLMGISYVIGSALVMSLVGVVLVAGIVWVGRYVD
ncbi:MAG: amino acid transport protein [Verrucomicrobiota bacterium]